MALAARVLPRAPARRSLRWRNPRPRGARGAAADPRASPWANCGAPSAPSCRTSSLRPVSKLRARPGALRSASGASLLLVDPLSASRTTSCAAPSPSASPSAPLSRSWSSWRRSPCRGWPSSPRRPCASRCSPGAPVPGDLRGRWRGRGDLGAVLVGFVAGDDGAARDLIAVLRRRHDSTSSGYG